MPFIEGNSLLVIEVVVDNISAHAEILKPLVSILVSNASVKLRIKHHFTVFHTFITEISRGKGRTRNTQQPEINKICTSYHSFCLNLFESVKNDFQGSRRCSRESHAAFCWSLLTWIVF